MNELVLNEDSSTMVSSVLFTELKRDYFIKSGEIQTSFKKREKIYNTDLPENRSESEIDYLFNEKLKNSNGFIINENWQESLIFHAKIINITNEIVVCECLIDKENLTFQSRNFPRSLFEHIYGLCVGKFVFIKILSKPGSSRIDITDGKNFINKTYFDINDGWDDLRNSGMGKPIKFL